MHRHSGVWCLYYFFLLPHSNRPYTHDPAIQSNVYMNNLVEKKFDKKKLWRLQFANIDSFITFFNQFIGGDREFLTWEIVNAESLYDLPFFVDNAHWEREDDVFWNAIAAIGENAHRHPFAGRGTVPPIVHVITGCFSGWHSRWLLNKYWGKFGFYEYWMNSQRKLAKTMNSIKNWKFTILRAAITAAPRFWMVVTKSVCKYCVSLIAS